MVAPNCNFSFLPFVAFVSWRLCAMSFARRFSHRGAEAQRVEQ